MTKVLKERRRRKRWKERTRQKCQWRRWSTVDEVGEEECDKDGGEEGGGGGGGGGGGIKWLKIWKISFSFNVLLRREIMRTGRKQKE